MRQFVILLALAALAFFGWDYYKKNPEKFDLPWLNKAVETPGEESSAAGLPEYSDARDSAPPREFVSQIQIPPTPDGQKPTAPPGFLYITERMSAQTNTGVVAVVPGDLVKVLQRKSNGKVKVTNDLADFEVKETQTTRDTQTAVEAERRYHESRTLLR